MTIAALLASTALLVAPPAPAAPTATIAATPLDALRASLDALGATSPVRASVEHRFERRRDGQPAGSPAPVHARLAAGPDGLAVAWGPDALADLRRERTRRTADPDAHTPATDAMGDLDPAACARLLDAAGELRQLLDRATLLEQRPDALDGAPARLLRFKLDPALPAAQKRYVKELDATLSVWLAPDGVPLGAEVRVHARGRALLVVSFESDQLERYRFARAGDRLVVTRRELEQRSEGGGEKGSTRSTTVLALER